MNEDEVLKKLKDGKYVYNNSYWFRMEEDGSIYGECGAGCCDFDFEDFEELWQSFNEPNRLWHCD